MSLDDAKQVILFLAIWSGMLLAIGEWSERMQDRKAARDWGIGKGR